MKLANTGHVPDHELFACLDGEIDAAGCRAVRTHLETCKLCADRLAEFESLSQGVQNAVPGTAGFLSEGAFWVRLAGHLGSQPAHIARREERPWLRLLPSFGLAALGFIIEGLVTLALFAYTLINLGILPSFGSQVLQFILIDSGLGRLLENAGIIGTASLQSGLANLPTIGISHDALALFGIVLILSLVLVVVIGLLFVWNAPSVAVDDQDMRGVNVHAVR